MAAYRYFNNEKVTESSLTDAVVKRTSCLVADKEVLVVQDTSEYHYNKYANRIEPRTGLGETGRYALGYFAHPSLVLEASTASVLGLSDLYCWSRDPDREINTSSRKKRPIEDKESYKWIKGCLKSKEVLKSARHKTIIQDRDGDIYESFATIPDDQTDLLIRSKTDRKIEGSQNSLYEAVKSQVPCVVYEFEVSADNKKRQKRTAKMELRYCQARIVRPKNLPKSYPASILITIVQAKEQAASVPEGESAIEWILLSTKEIADFMDAVMLVYWYSLRWLIEELFGLHKSKGFNMEHSELRTGWGIRKLGIITMQAAIRVMQLKQARKEDCQLPIEVVFTQQEQQCLEQLCKRLEGKTEKLKNNNPRKLLSWAAWIIARYGGWSGYASQRPPGLTTLKIGLEKFDTLFQGWKLARQDINDLENES